MKYISITVFTLLACIAAGSGALFGYDLAKLELKSERAYYEARCKPTKKAPLAFIGKDVGGSDWHCFHQPDVANGQWRVMRANLGEVK
jgi:hypothetical protein